MEIRTSYKIKRMKIGSLEMMKAFIIYDDKTHENLVLIKLMDRTAIVLQKASNCPDLCILKMSTEDEVNVIGKIDDFDIINVKYNKFFGEVSPK